MFSVGATNGVHRRSSYSSTNEYVDFAAPGGEYSDWNDDGIDDLVWAYARWEAAMTNSPVPLVGAQGTSMASPHGAGFLASIKYYYEDIAKPFEINESLPTILKYTEVEKMLKANLLTNDVNKESREFDTTARPGRDDHLGYGIIDLEKAIKSIDAFKNGYFDSFDNLPYYEGPSSIKLETDVPSEFSLTPNGKAGSEFNSVELSYNSNFLKVTDEGNLNYTVVNAPGYSDGGWISTPITFEFPMADGADVPYEGYEVLAVGVQVLFHIKGSAYEINLPRLKVNLLNSEGEIIQEAYTAVTNGAGAIGLADVAPGIYQLQICSDINGDDAWCGSGEMAALSESFEVLASGISSVNLTMEAINSGPPNNAPVITSDPENSGTFLSVGEEYLYRVLATDEDYEDENNPANNGKPPRNWFDYTIELINEEDGSRGSFLSIDVIGEVTGKARDRDIGTWKVRIGVSDRIDTTYQEFLLEVDE